MQLSLQTVLPKHLSSTARIHQSGVWGVDVVVPSGEYVFIQAPSGAGKTTLMHLLYFLRNDYDGTIKWGDTTAANADDETIATLRTNSISIVFQDLRLFPTLTTWENIEIKRTLTNTTTETQVTEWMTRLGIADKKNATANTLSYGEQQRLAIIRALVQPYLWLLMDEPFSHLDTANRNKAIELILEVTKHRNAGLILADLNTNNYFPYTQTLIM